MSSQTVRKKSQTSNGPKHITKLQREMHTQMMKLVAEDIDVAEI